MKLHLAYFLTALLSANAQDGRDLVGYAPPRCDGKLVTKIVNMEKDGNGVQSTVETSPRRLKVASPSTPGVPEVFPLRAMMLSCSTLGLGRSLVLIRISKPLRKYRPCYQ